MCIGIFLETNRVKYSSLITPSGDRRVALPLTTGESHTSSLSVVVLVW